MKLLNNVLVKVIKGGYTDRVMILDNVPDHFFYRKAYPLVAVGEGQQQHWAPDMTKEMVDTLHEKLSYSQTGDGGIVFDMDNEQAKELFVALHRYIVSVTPIHQKPIEPAVNSIDSSDPRAMSLPKDLIPRAVLPVLSPPAGAQENPSKVATAAGTNAAALTLDVEAIKKQAVEDYKAQQEKENKNKRPATASKE